MSRQVLSITQINEYIRAMMDSDRVLTGLAVRGEISNYKVYPSGHHYFTLKDESSALRCVIFKGNALKLRFKPQNGMKIIAMGKISVYPRDGAYQLYCTAMAMDGVGDLYAAFEQLKERLSKEGLFDSVHKKPLPRYPNTIGIITSPAGAAIHDMLRILKKRYPLTHVKLLPVRVQGAEAPAEIAGAVCYANTHNLADLLIVGRGGGSIEDLWAFNDELVARAIYDSRIPVISAVGHEPDVTISDYVADLRAATPSNAAELAVPDQDTIRQQLDTMSATMQTAISRLLTASRRHLNILSASKSLQGPTQYISSLRNTLRGEQMALVSAMTQCVGNKRKSFISATAKLDAMSPLKVLTRGYAIAQTQTGKMIRSVEDVCIGDAIDLTVTDGGLYASVTGKREVSYNE